MLGMQCQREGLVGQCGEEERDVSEGRKWSYLNSQKSPCITVCQH